MLFPTLYKAQLLRRYKRFLADVEWPDGRQETVYCPNTGAMTRCGEAGSEVWLSRSDNPKRKYAYTWELTKTVDGQWICIHSSRANAVVKEALEAGTIEPLSGYQSMTPEVKCDAENSRIDFLLSTAQQHCYIEVKSVTLQAEAQPGLGLFPDAKSDRGRKHLRALMSLKQQGHRAILLFCVLHTGIQKVAAAEAIDSVYAKTLLQAQRAGVEVLVYGVSIDVKQMSCGEALVFQGSSMLR